MGKLVQFQTATPRKIAAILGKVRSLLVVFPGLRVLSNDLQHFVAWASRKGWDTPQVLPPSVKSEILECSSFINEWKGRNFVQDPTRWLASDASDYALGGLDVFSGLCTQDFFRTENYLHINIKELKGRATTLMARFIDGLIVSFENRGSLMTLDSGILRIFRSSISDARRWHV